MIRLFLQIGKCRHAGKYFENYFYHVFRVNVKLPVNTRLKYAYLTREPLQHFWYPDIYVDDLHESRKPAVGLATSYLRVFPNRRMLHSSMSNFDVNCPMDFSRYPVDVQVCRVAFESYSSTTDVLDFQWGNKTYIDAINLNQHDFDTDFSKVVRVYQTGRNSNKGNTMQIFNIFELFLGNFSTLIFNLKLKRNLNFHVTRTYIPSALFVLVAWASVFVPSHLLPGKGNIFYSCFFA